MTTFQGRELGTRSTRERKEEERVNQVREHVGHTQFSRLSSAYLV